MKSFLAPHDWSDYELIDSGKGRKLERFGHITLIRPEISADWAPCLSREKWTFLTGAEFIEEGPVKGHWEQKKELNDTWELTYPLGQNSLYFSMKITRFKHVGVFPEQAVNWDFLYNSCRPGSQVLNLFAHTGGASQAAALAGARVTHIDSVYSMVGWARDNGEKAGIGNVKWICEDSVRYVEKELKRQNRYDTIILDPPSFGQSKKGQTWKIERDLEYLLISIKKLMKPRGTIILNCYSPRMEEKKLIPLLKRHFSFIPEAGSENFRRLGLEDRGGRKIDCGILARITC